jgi:hypothetical protein
MQCAHEIYAEERQPDCTHIKRLHKLEQRMLPRHNQSEPPKADLHPLGLLEASEIVLRHWDLYGERGFDAAITLLRRVVERSRV